MPRPSRTLGFFKLDLNGDRVTEPSRVDPFDTLVRVVFIEATLPLVPPTYGLPEESVIDTVVLVPVTKKFRIKLHEAIF